MPLGNLTSQLFANIYLHRFDQFVKHTLGIRYYGRYVDDFVLVHASKDYLLSCLCQMRDFLSQDLHLTLHPHKIYCQSIHK
ncbi:RNA-directed DNA polymerase [Patescibacteria group bacterium]|nr:RNA-directed DNA polymerase [Patescibacteria group bacterium]